MRANIWLSQARGTLNIIIFIFNRSVEFFPSWYKILYSVKTKIVCKDKENPSNFIVLFSISHFQKKKKEKDSFYLKKSYILWISTL